MAIASGVPIDVIQSLPHVACENFFGRVFHLNGLRDDAGDWQLWIFNGSKLIRTTAVAADAAYYSHWPACPLDFRCRFAEFIHQVASWEKESWLIEGIQSDLCNLGASLAKLRLVHSATSTANDGRRMAATELEYIFIVCRSIFDLLQEILVELGRKILWHDTSIKTGSLPKSFAKVAINGEQAFTAEEIVDRRNLPMDWARAYAESAQFFRWLRQYRDNVMHSGATTQLLFTLPEGFGISTSHRPFSEMPIWNERNTGQNNIGSLHSVACYVVLRTLECLDRFTDLLWQNVKWPPPFAPGYSLFIRSPHIAGLHRLREGIESSPWYISADSNATAV